MLFLIFFQYIVNLGVSVMMPLIITVLGLIFGNKFSASFKSGLTVGVGFVGLNVIATLMTTSISPVTKALVENYNFHLVATDIGWGVGSSLALGYADCSLCFYYSYCHKCCNDLIELDQDNGCRYLEFLAFNDDCRSSLFNN